MQTTHEQAQKGKEGKNQMCNKRVLMRMGGVKLTKKLASLVIQPISYKAGVTPGRLRENPKELFAYRI